MASSSTKTIYQVSELTQQIQKMLEASYRSIWVEAEISSLSTPASGHMYFSLKDDNAQIRCAMFRGRANLSSYKPNEGDLVRVRGKVTVYAARGDMQMIIEHIEAAGEGLLQKRFEELKAKLQMEGLFAYELKKSLPQLPKSIAIITSPSGAAIQDVLSTLNRRFPSIPIRIYPTIVQGENAAKEIISALVQANREKLCDVIILTRGGGSMEDLWCFNDEALVRSIIASAIPVVSAIGHEVDTTLSDFAADLRAPTPTAAAEMVSPDKQEVLEHLLTFKSRLSLSKERYFSRLHQNIDWLTKRLRHPTAHIRQCQHDLSQLQRSLISNQQRLIETKKIATTHLCSRLDQIKIRRLISNKKADVAELSERLIKSSRKILNDKQQELNHLTAQLSAVSYERTLDRGYAIIKDTSGKIIAKSTCLNDQDVVEIQHSDGSKKAVIHN